MSDRQVKRAAAARPRSIAACLLVLLAAFPPMALAQKSLRQLPLLFRTLSDEAGVLSVNEHLALSRSLEDIRDFTGVRVVMVIADSTRPEAILDYAERLARRWARGGLIDVERTIFVVIAIGDRTMQVMPGRGLPSVDRALGNPGVTSDLAPLFRNQQYFEALMILSARLPGGESASRRNSISREPSSGESLNKSPVSLSDGQRLGAQRTRTGNDDNE